MLLEVFLSLLSLMYPLSTRFILHAKKTAFVIEHDFIMATYLADRVIVFEGQPARHATATPYVSSLRYGALVELTISLAF